MRPPYVPYKPQVEIVRDLTPAGGGSSTILSMFETGNPSIDPIIPVGVTSNTPAAATSRYYHSDGQTVQEFTSGNMRIGSWGYFSEGGYDQLVAPAAINNVSDAFWSHFGTLGTKTLNDSNGADGTLTADKITGLDATSFMRREFNGIQGFAYTLSALMSVPSGTDTTNMRIHSGGTTLKQVDLTTTPQWHSVTKQLTDSLTRIYPFDNTQGDVATDVILWGINFTRTSLRRSYTPLATVAADNDLSVAIADIPGLSTALAGDFSFEFDITFTHNLADIPASDLSILSVDGATGAAMLYVDSTGKLASYDGTTEIIHSQTILAGVTYNIKLYSNVGGNFNLSIDDVAAGSPQSFAGWSASTDLEFNKGYTHGNEIVESTS